jgi:hypothetical protein
MDIELGCWRMKSDFGLEAGFFAATGFVPAGVSFVATFALAFAFEADFLAALPVARASASGARDTRCSPSSRSL